MWYTTTTAAAHLLAVFSLIIPVLAIGWKAVEKRKKRGEEKKKGPHSDRCA